MGACRVHRCHGALPDLRRYHAPHRGRERILAWVHDFRRAAGTTGAGLDERERLTAPQHLTPDPRPWPAALARFRGPVQRCLAEQWVEQRPQRGHDALLPADDRTTDGRGAKRESKTLGSPRALSAFLDAEDQAGRAGDRPLGHRDLTAGTRCRLAYGCPRKLHSLEVRKSASGAGIAGEGWKNSPGRRPRWRPVLVRNLVRARG